MLNLVYLIYKIQHFHGKTYIQIWIGPEIVNEGPELNFQRVSSRRRCSRGGFISARLSQMSEEFKLGGVFWRQFPAAR